MEEESQIKKWEEARCPICFEHPHNAVLIKCSSYEKGCQAFMCNTSSRHSNCFNQFQKSAKSGNLSCPLCRGNIISWSVVEAAREFMNSKTRSCSTETCNFAGNYMELRKHARSNHPNVKPSDVDLERQRKWASLERESDRLNLRSFLPPINSSTQEVVEGEETLIYDEFFMIYNHNARLVVNSDHTNNNNNARMVDGILCFDDSLMMLRERNYFRANLIPRGNEAYINRSRNDANIMRQNNTLRGNNIALGVGDRRFNPAAHNNIWRHW